MTFITYSSQEQAGGRFKDTDLSEQKPLGFHEDHGLLRPYSNIFYWSYMWTEKGAEIPEHSHKGFEIITFVLNGEIEHYDSTYNGWKSLSAGDVQVIRPGNGFIHSERVKPGTSLLQIWTDPGLEQSLNQPASYDNYPSDKFPIIIEKGKSTRIYRGPGSPVQMQTENIFIKEVSLAAGPHRYSCNREAFVSGFVLEGNLMIRKNPLESYDFFIAKAEEIIEIKASTDCRLFIIESPLEPGYPTYAEHYRI